jgi:hypothetical protein
VVNVPGSADDDAFRWASHGYLNSRERSLVNVAR